MLTANQHAIRAAYPSEFFHILSLEQAEQSRQWLSHWNQLNRAATPLWSLPSMADKLNVSQLYVKDESVRSPLGSFKALGAPVALIRLILRLWPEQNLAPEALITGKYREMLKEFTVISATDGNHGRALAAAAETVGCRCVIVLHANVSVEREQAIAAYGAEIVRIKGNYDESVEEAARLATENGWYVVSDTSYDGYEDIPRDVMQGYGTIAAETIEQTNSQRNQACPFTHVFLQGGVGGLAAGIISYFWEFYGSLRPTFIVVEPKQADCLYQSAEQGKAAKATGTVDSVMAGLACGETSPLAWQILQPGADYFMLINDGDAVSAMRMLATGNDKDVPILAGESGAAGLAGLIVLNDKPEQVLAVGLNAQSRVLIINTEGATAPTVYQELVNESAESVLRRQAAWFGGIC